MNLQDEINQANNRYGDFNSTHEVYGVLKEELDEFWELVKMKPQVSKAQYIGDFDKPIKFDKSGIMISELTQIAAVALRAAKQLEENKIKHV